MEQLKRPRLDTEDNKGNLQSHSTSLWLPRVGSVTAKALAMLLTGKRISHLVFFKITNTYRLSARIYSLRANKWPVDDMWYSSNQKRYKRYYFSDAEINRLYQLYGDRLREFLDRVNALESRS